MSRSKAGWLFIRVLKLFGLAVVLAACASGEPATPAPDSSGGTGILVAPDFEDFYQQNGGAQVFGYPISAAFVDSESGRLTQYFQNLRLEFDQSTETVDVTPLGTYFVPPEAEQTPAPGPPAGSRRVFTETGFSVQDAFLAFYEANGGELVFGLPITPQLNEGGTLVQYFENAQFIWNPNAPPAFRVEVASLADLYYWQVGGPPQDTFTLDGSTTILEADVRATVKEPILYAGEEQVLYVTVITPDSLQLVQGAAVSVTVSYGGQSTEVNFEPTDARGQTQGVLLMPGVEPGDTVQVEVQAAGTSGVLGRTMLSFRTWW